MRGFKYILSILALIASVGMWGQYNPTSPAEPGVYHTLTLQATPTEAGSFNIGTTTSYSEGTTVNLRAYTNSGFKFAAWEQDGKVISTEAYFTYTMPARNVKLVARYTYDPNSPGEPDEPNLPVYSTLFLSVTPADGGYLRTTYSGNKYEVGSTVTVEARSNTDFNFVSWTENGEVISTSNVFQYVMKEGNPTLVAHFAYSPGSPGEPSEAQLYHKVFLNCNPEGAGYFNVESGNSYQESTVVSLQAKTYQWYTFVSWTMGDSIVSTSSSYNFVMPENDITLTANYAYNYDPGNPNEPNQPGTDQVNIYGMTENAVCGQTIIYPIYLENTTPVRGMVVDVQFPRGFTVQTDNVSLSGRTSGHEMTVRNLGNNNYRFTLLGEEAFTDNNGKMFEVPVTIPDTATMGFNYPVLLTHGVSHGTDGSQTPVTVRSGYIYVEKISEDGLYAKFSYDKLQGRVKFTNLSSANSVSYVWDFGDGTTSTEKHPLHTYAHSGYYTVRMTARGEQDTDLAEQTVLINDESSWRVEGMFYLSDEEKGVRYFTTADALLQFMGAGSVTGDVKVDVKADHEYSCPLTDDYKALLRSLQSELSAGSYTLSFTKSGTGRNPALCFGEQGETIDKSFVESFTLLGKNLSCEGVDLKLWGVSFNPAQIEKLSSQLVYSGEKTTEVDFSPISADLTFSWTLTNTPDAASGYLTSGVRTIPGMTIVNEGVGNCDLVYHIKGTREGVTFCEFNYTITVTPSLVGLFGNLMPEDGALVENTTVTLSWNSIQNAVFDVYLWNVVNQPPSIPVAEGTASLQFTTRDFCQDGNSYKWVVVARNESQTMVSDTMMFTVRSLPDLHVSSVDCSELTAGEKATVQWTVRNDGVGSTAGQEWNDYVWLVADAYGGTEQAGSSDNKARLLATVKNVTALESGGSYDNSTEVTLPNNIHGNYYLMVTTDMYSVKDIEWAAVGGSVINPYTPTTDGSGYDYLYATTAAAYNKVAEHGETATRSDNFFYKKVEIGVPNLPDLQITSVTARVLPPLDPPAGILYDEDGNQIDSWEECWRPSPITAAGLRQSTEWYSGKKVAVTVTIRNIGTRPTGHFDINYYVSHSSSRDEAELGSVGRKNSGKEIEPGETITLTYAFVMPYHWSGDTWIHVHADNDARELAQTANNWSVSEQHEVRLCPAANLVPTEIIAPKTISSAEFNLNYSVVNRGAGVPYASWVSNRSDNVEFFSGNINNPHWTDVVYISKKNTGLDASAHVLATCEQQGGFERPAGKDVSAQIPPEEYTYKGDNYSSNVLVRSDNLKNLQTGTYYIYVKTCEQGLIVHHVDEASHVMMYGPVRFVQPDLTAQLVSVSADTLKTGAQVAFTWKVRNTGEADIANAILSDDIYATVNQTATGGTKIATVKDTVWIAAGQEKTRRALITIPKDDKLDGLRYLYVVTNAGGIITEADRQNNASNTVRSWCKYTTEPVLNTERGANLHLSDVKVPANLAPGSTVTLTYIAQNNGDTDLPQGELTQELFLSKNSSNYKFDFEEAAKCTITRQTGSVSGLKSNRATNISLTFTVPDVQGGEWYLHLFVDRSNTLREYNTSDNHESTKVFVTGNLADLLVTDYALSDTVMTSVDVPLTFTVSNTGDWDAGATTTNVYLSADDKQDSKDLLLASLQTSALAQGATANQQATLNIPDKMAGNWYVLVQTDVHKKLSERNKDNNVKAIPVNVVQSPLPDLTVTEVNTDGDLVSGQPLKVCATIGNIGKNATRTDKWADVFYLSSSAVLNTQTAIRLGSKTHVGTLQVGAEYTAEMTVNIPVEANGNYMLFVVTDAGDALLEEDENNNTRSVPVFITGSAETPADLQIAHVTASPTIKAGENVTITYQIENNGEYGAAANLSDAIYLSEDSKWDVNDVMVGVVSGNVSIDPGNAITRSATGRITNMPEGNYYVIVKTNSTHTVSEADYDNNTGVMKSPSRLAFNTVSLGSTAQVNTAGYYKLDIPDGYEGKTVGFTLEHPADVTPSLYAAFEQVPNTARYDFMATAVSETGLEVLIPKVQAGNYYILAQDNASIVGSTGNVFSLSDDGQQTAEVPMSLTANEIHFGATKLSVTEGGTDGWVSTNVSGALFDSIMDFRLKMDQTVIPAEMVTMKGMTVSRVTFNLRNAETGTYDIVSELPDGTQATLPQGFKVVPGVSVPLSAKVEAPFVVRQNSYVPITATYANGGNTDCEIKDFVIAIDQGYLATTIEGLEKHQSSISLPIDGEYNERGFKTIAPGTQRSINLFMYQTSGGSQITFYIIQ